MAHDVDDSGFLSRWSRRKTLVRQGAAEVEPAAEQQPAQEPPRRIEALAVPAALAPRAAPLEAAPLPAAPEPAEPLPTLADVAALTRDSDYTRFMGSAVQPEVKNAALAKLFTDPHFNVMDGLDTYIDDYGKPDPLPPGMLRQMLQAHTLGLFDEEDEAARQAALLEQPAPLPLDAAAPPPPLESATDEDTDLQLQPDDDAGRAGLEAGAGEDAGQPH